MVDLIALFSNQDFGDRVRGLTKPGKVSAAISGSQPARRPRRVQHRLRPDEVTELTSAYRAGASVKELAAKYRLNRNTVTAHLRRHGIKPRQRGLTPTEVIQASQLYADGWSLERIGKHLGVRDTSVRYRLLRAGVSIRSRNGWRYDAP